MVVDVLAIEQLSEVLVLLLEILVVLTGVILGNLIGVTFELIVFPAVSIRERVFAGSPFAFIFGHGVFRALASFLHVSVLGTGQVLDLFPKHAGFLGVAFVQGAGAVFGIPVEFAFGQMKSRIVALVGLAQAAIKIALGFGKGALVLTTLIVHIVHTAVIEVGGAGFGVLLELQILIALFAEGAVIVLHRRVVRVLNALVQSFVEILVRFLEPLIVAGLGVSDVGVILAVTGFRGSLQIFELALQHIGFKAVRAPEAIIGVSLDAVHFSAIEFAIVVDGVLGIGFYVVGAFVEVFFHSHTIRVIFLAEIVDPFLLALLALLGIRAQLFF